MATLLVQTLIRKKFIVLGDYTLSIDQLDQITALLVETLV